MAWEDCEAASYPESYGRTRDAMNNLRGTTRNIKDEMQKELSREQANFAGIVAGIPSHRPTDSSRAAVESAARIADIREGINKI